MRAAALIDPIFPVHGSDFSSHEPEFISFALPPRLS